MSIGVMPVLLSMIAILYLSTVVASNSSECGSKSVLDVARSAAPQSFVLCTKRFVQLLFFSHRDEACCLEIYTLSLQIIFQESTVKIFFFFVFLLERSVSCPYNFGKIYDLHNSSLRHCNYVSSCLQVKFVHISTFALYFPFLFHTLLEILCFTPEFLFCH